eukprot:jgi/Botrbrau1/7954/Bobra.9_2s0112.1
MQTVCVSSSLTCRPALQQLRQSRRPVRAQRSLITAVRSEKGSVTDQGDQKIVDPGVPDRRDISQIEAGNISNENAERRADIGYERAPKLSEAQAFDGPAPETINGRAAMLAVFAGLGAELATGVGIKEQVWLAGGPILLTFVIVALASYVPIVRGFTRKEPFANAIFSPKAENWNGRLAMLGFAGIILTEALAGTTVVNLYNIPHGTAPFTPPF